MDAKERLAFSKGGKEATMMTVGDAILNLVDQLLNEREKVVRLELLREQQSNKDEKLNKD